MARQREGFVGDLRRRVWSGSSIVNMLAASVQIQPGIHQRNSATSPSLRIVNVTLSFRMQPASSLVVMVHAFPMIGKHTSTTGPADRSFASRLAGNAQVVLTFVKSIRSMTSAPWVPKLLVWAPALR
jgi:hypothetical protein